MRSALLLTLPALVAPAQAIPPKPIPTPKATSLIDVRVDQRFELMSIVCRLAGFKEYQKEEQDGGIEAYNEAVEQHFGPFRSHAAVQMAKELKEKSRIAFDAIPNLAIRAQDAVTFRPTLDFNRPDAGLDARWKVETAHAFLKAMADFAKASKAKAFFKSQDPFYKAIVDDCQKNLIQKVDRKWFETTFSNKRNDTFIFCPAPLNGSYGPSVPNKTGFDIYAFAALRGLTPKGTFPVFSNNMGTLLHEFLHGYTNPWVENHWHEIQGAADALFEPEAERMKSYHYGSSKILMYESMVRAFVVRYWKDHGDTERSQYYENTEEKWGFYYVKPLTELLGELTSKPNKYNNLEAFTPRLVEAFKLWASKAPEMAAAAQKESQKRAEAEKAAKSQAEVGASK